jgi:AcrR family transcriptional regulator
MPGLRAKQKEKRREAIMGAASKLFKNKGFTATSMEGIAAEAELSVGTVYNYFKTKGDICLAIYRADRDLVETATDKVIANPPADPVAAIIKLMETDFETELDFVDRSVWESLLVAAFTAEPHLAAQLMDDDFKRIGQFEKLLTALKARKHLGAGVDVKTAAELLGALNLLYFINWVVEMRSGEGAKGGNMLDAAARKTLRRQVKQLVDGLKG